MSYLCNRNRETKIANDKVPWMSGLVSGLQNRVRRFESARNLLITSKINMQKGISIDYSLLHIIYKKQRLQLLKSIPIYTYIQKVSRLSLKKNLELFLYSED